MFTYTTLSLTMVGALLLFVVMQSVVNMLRKVLGYHPVYIALWVLFSIHWLVAFGLIVSFSSWNIPRLSPWYVLAVVSVFMVLMCLYLNIIDRLEREKKSDEFRGKLDDISKRYLERFRDRMRRNARQKTA